MAACAVCLIAVTLLTTLAGYLPAAADTSTRTVLASAPPSERSLLVHGSAPDLAAPDAALRASLTHGLGGTPVRVRAARYATGRQLTGPTGRAVPDAHGLVFASFDALDRLPEYAALTSGRWPRAGASPLEVTLAESAAHILGYRVGDSIPVTDRRTDVTSQVMITGVWHPRDLQDPYWLLVPEAKDGTVPGSATYGPFVVAEDDFRAGFSALATGGWVVQPELATADVSRLCRAAAAATRAAGTLPRQTGLGDSTLVATGMQRLADRLRRADLAGRSALLTPLLLIAVLGGYALTLVANLLAEQRRAENALLRARGAGRRQLAGLALVEAAVVTAPAVVLAPLLAAGLCGQAGRLGPLAGGVLTPPTRLEPASWAAAAAAAAGCALSMLIPAVRNGDRYARELAGRHRGGRRAALQRAGADGALVVLAVLAWLELRWHSSSSTDIVGVDPVLTLAPVLAVLAGALLALRPLAPLARAAQRLLDRRPWPGAMLGAWQAGRRPHAGPVLLLAVTVAVTTMAWCLAATSRRSIVDQADHATGSDLRLIETGGFAPPGRADAIRGLPGEDGSAPGPRAASVLPVSRNSLVAGPRDTPISVLGIDTSAAAGVVRLRDDLASGSSSQLFARLAQARRLPDRPVLPIAGRLTGEITTDITAPDPTGTHTVVASDAPPVQAAAVLVDADGDYRELPLGVAAVGQPLRFSVELPATTRPSRLAGFREYAQIPKGSMLSWRLTGLAAVPTTTGVPGMIELASAGWQLAAGDKTKPVDAGSGSLHGEFTPKINPGRSTVQDVVLTIAAASGDAPVPAAATPAALAALRLDVGSRTSLPLGAATVDVQIVRRVTALPGGATDASLLLDGPALDTASFAVSGALPTVQEWWLASGPRQHAATAAAARRLDGLTVLDRRQVAAGSRHEPYGVGARTALFLAALGAMLLAGVGTAFEVRATARRRLGELAVLHLLGAGHRLLARSLIAEQSLLAGAGVAVGLLAGMVSAAGTAPLVLLTPTADRPVPQPLLSIAWYPAAGCAAGLFALALALAGLVTVSVRRRLTTVQLRIGQDR